MLDGVLHCVNVEICSERMTSNQDHYVLSLLLKIDLALWILKLKLINLSYFQVKTLHPQDCWFGRFHRFMGTDTYQDYIRVE